MSPSLRGWAALLCCLLMALAPAAALADVNGPPRTMTFQGDLCDSSGEHITGSHDLVFSLYDSAEAVVPLWTESHPGVAVDNGVFSVVLGSLVDLTPSFAHQYWLGITVDGDAEMTPRTSLHSAPYALNAAAAEQGDWLGGVAGPGLAMNGSGTSATLGLDFAGTGAADTPARSDHTHDNYVAVSGDTMTGQLFVNVSGAHAFQALASGSGSIGVSANSSGGPALYANQTGTSDGAVWAQVNNSSGAGTAVYGITTGTGKAAHFRIFNSSNSAAALYAETDGTGVAGLFAGEVEITGTGNGLTFPDGTRQTTAATGGGGGVDSVTPGTGMTNSGTTSDPVLNVTYGASSGTATQGNDSRLLSTSAKSDLTGAGDTGLHYHSTDRNWNLLTNVPAGFADDVDNVDDSVSWSEISGIVGTSSSTVAAGDDSRFLSTTQKTDLTDSGTTTLHNHDSRYYTENESILNFINEDGDAGMTGAYTYTNVAMSLTSPDTDVPLQVYNTGYGMAGYFAIQNTSSGNTALKVETNGGAGSAANFFNTNTSNSYSTMYAEHSGSGNAVEGVNSGTGRAGYFKISDTGNTDVALFSETYGTGRAAYFGGYNTTSTSAATYFGNSGRGSVAYFSSGNSSDPLYAAVHIQNSRNHYAFRVEHGGTDYAGVIIRGNDESLSQPSLYVTHSGISYAGYFSGPVHVNGNLTKSSGSFVQPHPSEPSKEVVYAFFEGPEHAVFLRGRAKLEKGRAEIVTPEHFRVVAAEEGILIQLTPRSLGSKGLAAYQVSRKRILVGELMDGQGDYEFDYFITAKRDGFQAHEPIQANQHFSANGVSKSEFEKRYARDDISSQAMRNLLIKNGVLHEDGTLNMTTARALGWDIAPDTEAVAAAD